MFKIYLFLFYLFSNAIYATKCAPDRYNHNFEVKSSGIGINLGDKKIRIIACSNPKDCENDIEFESGSTNGIEYEILNVGTDSSLVNFKKRKDDDHKKPYFPCAAKLAYEFSTFSGQKIEEFSKSPITPFFRKLKCENINFLNLRNDITKAKTIIHGKIVEQDGEFYLMVFSSSNTKISAIKIKNFKQEMAYFPKNLIGEKITLYTLLNITGDESEIESIPFCSSLFSSAISLFSDSQISYFRFGQVENQNSKNSLNIPPTVIANYVAKFEMNNESRARIGGFPHYLWRLSNEKKIEEKYPHQKKIYIEEYREKYQTSDAFKNFVDNQYRPRKIIPGSKLDNYLEEYSPKKEDFQLLRKQLRSAMEGVQKSKLFDHAHLVNFDCSDLKKLWITIISSWSGAKPGKYEVDSLSLFGREEEIIRRDFCPKEKGESSILLSKAELPIIKNRIQLTYDYYFVTIGSENFQEIDQAFKKYFKPSI